MAQQPTLGGVIDSAWDFVTGTFKDWIDREIPGAELALEQATRADQAGQAAATAPQTATTVAGLPLWLVLAAGGLVVVALLWR